jgi:hypothetical protein
MPEALAQRLRHPRDVDEAGPRVGAPTTARGRHCADRVLGAQTPQERRDSMRLAPVVCVVDE